MAIPDFCYSLAEGWPHARGPVATIFTSVAFDPSLFCEKSLNQDLLQCLNSLNAASTKRRAEFLAGRYCAQKALFNLIGVPYMPERHKDKTPIWPQNCVGSISHTSGLAGAMVARRTDYKSVGIDLERPLSSHECSNDLIRTIQTPAEQLRMTTLLRLSDCLALTLAFSLKESLFKALHPLVCIFFNFKDVELMQCDITGNARFRLLKSLSPEWEKGTELTAHFYINNEYILTWAVIAEK